MLSERVRTAAALLPPKVPMSTGAPSSEKSVARIAVGVKKFQCDIWGDTVNIASRMESNGEPGKVNLSDATYQLVKDPPQLKFIPRGFVDAKGKGPMMMYFVDAATNA